MPNFSLVGVFRNDQYLGSVTPKRSNIARSESSKFKTQAWIMEGEHLSLSGSR